MNRYYMIVGLDVPGHFVKGASSEQEQQSAAILVDLVLREAFAERGIDISVRRPMPLSPDDFDRVITVLQNNVDDLRAEIDRIVKHRKEIP
jgi:protein-tyrosine-phosphatase